MLFQNRYNTIQLAAFDASGQEIDALTLTAAEYRIYDCNKVSKIDKSLSNGGLTIVDVDGVNVLQCTIAPDECKDLCGRVTQELKVALVSEQWLGAQLSTNQITFAKTKN